MTDWTRGLSKGGESQSVSNVSSAAFFEGMDDRSALPALSDDLDIFKVFESDEWPLSNEATTLPADVDDFDFESLAAVLLPNDEEADNAAAPSTAETVGAITPAPVLEDCAFGQLALTGSSSGTAEESCEDETLNGMFHEACSSAHSKSQSPTASEGRVQHSKRPREASEGSAEVVPKQTGEKKSKAQIEEERLQKRLAKNRRTAAESRERKKQAMKDMSSELQVLRDENTRLKQELEVQKMHTQLLREELASFTRSAKEGTADAAATEPAALISTTNLPSVHDTVMTMQRRSAPSSSNQQLVAVWSVLACLYLTSQTAGSVIETLSKLATTNPEAAANLVKAFSESDAGSELLLGSSPSTATQRIAPDRCIDLGATPWRSSPQIEIQTA